MIIFTSYTHVYARNCINLVPAATSASQRGPSAAPNRWRRFGIRFSLYYSEGKARHDLWMEYYD